MTGRPLLELELGDRAAGHLHAENAGITWQRRHALTDRLPARFFVWRIHYTDGVPTSASWAGAG